MKKFSLLGVLSLMTAVTLTITGCGTTPNNNTGQQTGETVTVNAEAIAKQNCISCHGDTFDGRGDAKKNLQTVGARLSKEQITDVIANGRNNMPAFNGRLKDEEIAALSDWLSAKK